MHPPTASATHPPVEPLGHAPAYPPHAPMQRSFLAVQGVVYCKSCKYAGDKTLLGATPVLGATVKLACNNTYKKLTIEEAKTDKNGYSRQKVIGGNCPHRAVSRSTPGSRSLAIRILDMFNLAVALAATYYLRYLMIFKW